MLKLWRRVKSTMRREEGQSLVEYGLIIALIAIVVIAALTLIGGHLQNLFGNIANSL